VFAIHAHIGVLQTYLSWHILRYRRMCTPSQLLEIAIPPLSTTPTSGCAISSLGMKLTAYENFLKDYLHVVLTSTQLSALLPASSSES
jgi:hypothetical protein